MYRLTELAQMLDVNLRSLHNQIIRGNLDAFKVSPHRWGVTDANLFKFLSKNPAYHWRLQESAKNGSISAIKCLELFSGVFPDRCPIYSRGEIVELLNKPIGWYKYRQIDKKAFSDRFISQRELVDYLARDKNTRQDLLSARYSTMKRDILNALQARGIKL